jgi:hypothetical protein
MFENPKPLLATLAVAISPILQTVATPRGPVVTTGTIGDMQTTTLPRAAGQGLLINNGNGTSTLIGQGGTVMTVPTPK